MPRKRPQPPQSAPPQQRPQKTPPETLPETPPETLTPEQEATAQRMTTTPPPRPQTPQPANPRASPTTTGKITLANHVQLMVEGKPVLYRAGHTYTLGDDPGQLPPSILTRQPLLDLDHPAHVESRAELAEIDQKAQRNDQLARQRSLVAAQGVGVPPTNPHRHGIV